MRCNEADLWRSRCCRIQKTPSAAVKAQRMRAEHEGAGSTPARRIPNSTQPQRQSQEADLTPFRLVVVGHTGRIAHACADVSGNCWSATSRIMVIDTDWGRMPPFSIGKSRLGWAAAGGRALSLSACSARATAVLALAAHSRGSGRPLQVMGSQGSRSRQRDLAGFL
jgi:hypothetical protein